jgi:enoyl-CoA hydratase/carnithine racemase
VRNNVAHITLNRPERLNALSRPLLQELGEALDGAAVDDEVGCIVIKGAGRAFSAGYDMNVQTEGSLPRDALGMILGNHPTDMYKKSIWDNPKPVIAQVHSFTLAGGGQLACHCDITIAADDALFGYPPVRYASVMAYMIWPELVGMKKAKQLAFTGSMMNAQEALRTGLVSEVVPRDELDERVEALAATIAKVPPESTHLNKMAINNYYESQGMFQSFKYAEHLMYISYSAPADLLTHGLQDVDRVTAEQGMRAGFQYMNSGFEEEDLIAQGQMARPTRTP